MKEFLGARIAEPRHSFGRWAQLGRGRLVRRLRASGDRPAVAKVSAPTAWVSGFVGSSLIIGGGVSASHPHHPVRMRPGSGILRGVGTKVRARAVLAATGSIYHQG